MSETYSQQDFTALVCLDHPEHSAAVIEQLTSLGFNIETAETAEAALSGLQAACDIVVTSDDFGGADAFTNPVLSEINGRPQEERRKIFEVLIGPNQTTQSETEAFSLSVDLVLQTQDIPRLKALVTQYLARKENFYRVFHAVEKAVEAEIS